MPWEGVNYDSDSSCNSITFKDEADEEYEEDDEDKAYDHFRPKTRPSMMPTITKEGR